MKVNILVKKVLKFDKDILSTLIFRGWSSIAGIVMVLLIPITLNPKEQGYFYTFSSLVALQVFFELGLNQAIIQIAGYEFSKLASAENKKIGYYQYRISSLTRALNKWYQVISLLFLFTVLIAGFYFFSKANYLEAGFWMGPWIVIILSTSVNLYLSHKLTLIESAGRIADIARMRTTQSIIGYILVWLALILNQGLWAITALAMTSTIYSIYWLQKDKCKLKPNIAIIKEKKKETINWRKEIFPLQWRFAITWLSGYLLYQLFVPLDFSFNGASSAGKLGITIVVFTGILSIGVSWVTAKNPAMVTLIANNNKRQLNKLFRSIALRNTFFVIFFSGIFLLFLSIGKNLSWLFVQRFASIEISAFIALATISNSIVFSAALYMRAHRQEPLIWSSAVTGVLNGVSAYFLVRHGSLYMMQSYAIIATFISLPWTLFHLHRFYKPIKIKIHVT